MGECENCGITVDNVFVIEEMSCCEECYNRLVDSQEQDYESAHQGSIYET